MAFLERMLDLALKDMEQDQKLRAQTLLKFT